MADPYWRYASAAPPLSSERGSSIPKPTFPGHLSSDTSTLTTFIPHSSTDLRGTSAFLENDILASRPEAYSIDDLTGIRPEPGHVGYAVRDNANGHPSSLDDPNLMGHRTPGIRPEPGHVGYAVGVNANGYPSLLDDPNLIGHRTPGIRPDVDHERPSSIRRLDAVGVKANGYPSSLDDPNLIGHRTPGIRPDVDHERPSSIRRLDGPHSSVAESNVLFVDGLPTDSTRREIGHIFRPFIGFRELRVVHKEPRRRGDKAMVLCFVEFSDAKCALTAMEALQGYKFDDRKPESSLLKIHFAHFPFRLPSDRVDERVGAPR